MELRRFAGIGILAAAVALPVVRGTFGADSDPTCPQIVHAALAATEQYCEGTGRNKVCYGNVRVEAEPRPELAHFAFKERGDTVDVADIESVRTSPMNPRTGEWGVALMRLQALRGRGSDANLTVVLMGDAELQQPRPLAAAQTATTSQADAAQGPMYAFSFRSGQDVEQCAEVPDSGMLIQTPEGVAEVTLLINEVDVQLGSTVYFQAVPNRALEVYVLEGHADVTAQGQTETVPAGATASVPLQNNHPAGPPTDAKPYQPEEVANAPLPLLERPVEIAPPADDGDSVVNGPVETPTATPDGIVEAQPTVELPTEIPTEIVLDTPTPIALTSPTPYDPLPVDAPTVLPDATATLDPSGDPVAQASPDAMPEPDPNTRPGKGGGAGRARDLWATAGPTPTPGRPASPGGPSLGRGPAAVLPPIWQVDWMITPTPQCDPDCPTPIP